MSPIKVAGDTYDILCAVVLEDLEQGGELYQWEKRAIVYGGQEVYYISMRLIHFGRIIDVSTTLEDKRNINHWAMITALKLLSE